MVEFPSYYTTLLIQPYEKIYEFLVKHSDE